MNTESGDDVLTPRESVAAPAPIDAPAADVLETDCVSVPRLPLEQLQTAAPKAGIAVSSVDSSLKQQAGIDDDDPLVEFNVGGAHYVSSLSTITAVPGSAFASVVEGNRAHGRRRSGEGETDDAVATFDRDGPSFRWVLIYLRWVGAGSIPPLALPQDAGERQQLAEEAAFYGLPELEQHCRRPRLSQFELMQVRASEGCRLATGVRDWLPLLCHTAAARS